MSEDFKLTEDINGLNERLYQTEWQKLSPEKVNSEMEDIKSQAIAIIKRMRDDISKNTILEISDFFHIFSGFNIQKYLERRKRGR